MSTVLVKISALLLGFALLSLGNGMFGTLLTVRMLLEAFSTPLIGQIQAAFYIGFAAGTLFGAPVVEQVGHIRAFAVFAAVMASSVLGHALFVDAFFWALLRTIEGFSLAGLFIVTESWLNAKTTSALRGQVFSFYMIINYTCLGIGQVFLNLADPQGFELFSLGAMLFALSLVPIALTRGETPSDLPLPEPALHTPVRFGFGQLYTLSPLGVATCLAAGLLTSAFFAMGPIYAASDSVSVSSLAFFMSGAIFSGLLIQWPLGVIADRFDRRKVILAVAGLATLINGFIVFLNGMASGWFLLLIYMSTGLVFTLYGLGAAHANDAIQPEQTVSASAGLLLAFGIGASIGPLGAAALMEKMGHNGLFGFFAFITLTLIVFALYRMARGMPIAAEDKNAFVSVPVTTTPSLANLDPRSEPAQGDLDLVE